MARAYDTGDPRAAVNGRKGGIAGAKTKQLRAIKRASAAVGLTLTAREALIYRRGHANGYSLGQKTGEARGYRKGYSAAIGERYDTDAPLRILRRVS